jgi:hypothetical protein
MREEGRERGEGERALPLSLSPPHAHTRTLTLARSHSHAHTRTLPLARSHSHAPTRTLPLARSHTAGLLVYWRRYGYQMVTGQDWER